MTLVVVVTTMIIIRTIISQPVTEIRSGNFILEGKYLIL
jgi:hypothetical protein